MLKRLILSTLIAVSLPSCLHAQNFKRNARSGIETLQHWYNPTTGLYNTTGWWNSANALTVLADYNTLGPHPNIKPTSFPTAFSRPQKSPADFLNNYYDDEGWWALAWIDAYDITHHAQYLACRSPSSPT